MDIPGRPAEIAFQNAIQHWWTSKNVNAAGVDNSQGGTRDQNLRGDTMDGFRDAIVDCLLAEGVAREDIYCGSQMAALPSNLPSFFRASKNWDVVVCRDALHKRLTGAAVGEPYLVAAVEFKSQDKSIGNNQNNRIEESIGNAHDFWASYENENFARLIPRPWLGYLFVGRYGQGDENLPVRIKQPLFPTDVAFAGLDPALRLSSSRFPGPSYAERYRVFLRRMLAKKLYDGACFLVTHEDIAQQVPNYRVLYDELSGEEFLGSLRRHVRANYNYGDDGAGARVK